MNLFEFLMILLSLIVGLGIAEILSGIGRYLKRSGKHEIPWMHVGGTLAIFIGLLQIFWESWGLRTLETWTFPAMLMMLGSPICLYLMAHIIFPELNDDVSLNDHYLEKARMIWPLAGLTVIIGTLFRPLAFGDALWTIDNASGIPILVVCAVLTLSRRILVHQLLIPVVLVAILADTLTFSHSIG